MTDKQGDAYVEGLVERLRRKARHEKYVSGKVVGRDFAINPDGPEAADTITALRTQCEAMAKAAQPIIAAIDVLERDYGFDRPMHQGQCLMLALGDLIAFRAALQSYRMKGTGDAG